MHTHKIALLLDGLEASTAGGTERQALVLARWLREAGHDVRIYVFRGHEFSAEFPIHNLGYRSWWRPASLLRLLELVRELRRDRICALQSFFVESNLLGPILARGAGVPVILGSRRNVNHWMSPAFARLQQASNSLCTAIIANSDAVKTSIIAKERVPAGKAVVLYNGVDLSVSAEKSARQRLRSEWGIPDEAFVFGVLATLRPVKGIDNFVRAAGELLSSSEPLHFVVVGDGPDRKQLEAQAAALNHRIHFVGERNDVAECLRALDVAVLPSRAEGFSNALLEYMRAGLPIVATDVGGNREALEGTGALVVAPDNVLALRTAMESLRDSPELRNAIAKRVMQRVKHFDLSKQKQITQELYGALLKGHAGRKR